MGWRWWINSYMSDMLIIYYYKKTIRATEHRYSALESLESQLFNTLPMSSVCIILFLWSYFLNCMQYKGIGAIMKIPLFIGSILKQILYFFLSWTFHYMFNGNLNFVVRQSPIFDIEINGFILDIITGNIL